MTDVTTVRGGETVESLEGGSALDRGAADPAAGAGELAAGRVVLGRDGVDGCASKGFSTRSRRDGDPA